MLPALAGSSAQLDDLRHKAEQYDCARSGSQAYQIWLVYVVYKAGTSQQRGDSHSVWLQVVHSSKRSKVELELVSRRL